MSINKTTMDDSVADGDAMIARMMAMGATLNEATLALEESDWNVDRAMAQLFGKQDNEAARYLYKTSSRKKSSRFGQPDDDDDVIASMPPRGNARPSPTKPGKAEWNGKEVARKGLERGGPRSTSSFAMMALTDTKIPSSIQDTGDEVHVEGSGTPIQHREPHTTHPGAVAVGTTGREEEFSAATPESHAGTMAPVLTAHLVEEPTIVEAQLQNEDPPDTPPPESNCWSKRRNRFLVGGVIAVVVILVVALAVVVSGRDRKTEPVGQTKGEGPTLAPVPFPVPSLSPATPPTTQAPFPTTQAPPSPTTFPPTTSSPTNPAASFPPTEPVECEDGNDLLVVELMLDDRQEETTFELRDSVDVLDTGGPFDEDTAFVTTQYCVPGRSLFIIAVLDSAGDGLCCDFGIGAYRISINGEILPTEEFNDGFQQTIPIILPLAEPPSCGNLLVIEFVVDDSSASETSWELKKDGVVETSSEGPFDEGLAATRIQTCLDDGAYIFTVFDSAGDGLDGAYSLIFNGKAIPTEEFTDGFEKSVEFATNAF